MVMNPAAFRDLLAGVVVAVVGLYLTATSFSYPAHSSGFPRALSVLLTVLALVLVVNGLRARKAVPVSSQDEAAPSPDLVEPAESVERANVGALAFTLIGGAVYVALIPVLGFFTAATVYLIASFIILGHRRGTTALLYPVAFCASLYLLFSKFLGVPFPTGLFL